jgi:class 3 adenylate cyclase
MQCPRYGHPYADAAKFCDECGAPLPLYCHACGAANRHGAKFCSDCGTALTTHTSAPAHAPSAGTASSEERPATKDAAVGRVSGGTVPSASPQAYTPTYLVEKILTMRSALEGERKLVTVLFADITDSSALVQRIDGERLHQLMGEVLQLMAETMHRYEGTVNQYLGDGLMALFGAPIAIEDHAFRAVQAALAIQETIRGYSAQFQREHGVELRLRVGLNTGPVWSAASATI